MDEKYMQRRFWLVFFCLILILSSFVGCGNTQSGYFGNDQVIWEAAKNVTSDPQEQAAQEALASTMMDYLNCPSQYLAPMKNEKKITKIYSEAKARGEKEGFIPVLVAVDETLWEHFLWRTDHEGELADSFDAAKVAAYREEMLTAPLREGPQISAQMQAWRKEMQDYGFDGEEELRGKMMGGEMVNDLHGCRNYFTGGTLPMILAEIPVEHSWQVFAWLPFGGWNNCPDTQELMETAKYWFEQYGAVPAVIAHDVLEFTVPQPVSKEQAGLLALEQWAFNPDLMDVGIGRRADSLTKSTVWYFWWD